MFLFNPALLPLLASRFKALSELNRLRIIISLRSGAKNVSSLSHHLRLTQSNLSRHLDLLVENGLLQRRKNGLSVYYSIKDPAIFQICDQVCGGLARQLDAQARAFRPREAR